MDWLMLLPMVVGLIISFVGILLDVNRLIKARGHKEVSDE
jgi:hypothetical protein